MEAFEPKRVKFILNIIVVNSLRLGGLQIILLRPDGECSEYKS